MAHRAGLPVTLVEQWPGTLINEHAAYYNQIDYEADLARKGIDVETAAQIEKEVEEEERRARAQLELELPEEDASDGAA